MSEALISRLGRAEARASAPAEVPPRAPAVIGSFRWEIEKVKFTRVPGCLGRRSHRGVDWKGWRCASHFAVVPPTLRSAWRSFTGRGALFYGERRSYRSCTWPLKTCHGNCSRNGSVRGIFQRNLVSVSSMSSILYNGEVVRCSSTRHVSWRCSGKLRALTRRSLRSAGSCWALTTACVQDIKV
jgi:hypothetical protein